MESTKIELQTRFLEFEKLENEFGVLRSQLEDKASDLDAIERLIEEKSKELEDLTSLIQEHSEELTVKERQYSDAEIRVGEKERESDSIERRARQATRKLNWTERNLEEKSKLDEAMEKKLIRKGRELDQYSEDIELKERKLNEILRSIKEQEKRLSLTEGKIKASERSIDEWDKKVKLEEEKLSSIQKSVVEGTKEIESKEEILRELDLKVKGFHLHKKSMEEWSCKLQLKEKQFESKVEELTKKINDCLSEIQLEKIRFSSLEKLIAEREKNVDLQEKSLQEGYSKLEMKERQLDQRAKELELIQGQVDLIQKSTAEHTQNVEYPPARIVTVPSSPSNQTNINRGGRGLQLLMNKHLKRIDSLDSEMSAHLKASSDPAELVLDAMQGFYSSNSTVDKTEFDFDLNVIRRSCILLLQGLKNFSPQINPQVREEAIKLAADWKGKMKVAAENFLEILAFMWLLIAFELTSLYDAKELLRLLAIVPQEHASVLSQALGIKLNVPVGSSNSFPIKIEELEASPEINVATTSSPIVQPSATMEVRSFQGCINEVHSSGNQSVQDTIFDALQISHDPENLVLKLMEKSLNEYWEKGGVGPTLMLKNISMLKKLTKVLPHVGFDKREAALKLAVKWARKMKGRADNSLEIVSFLQFIATFGLLSTFTIDEIASLLGTVSQNKQDVELLQRLGFADNIPDFIRNLIGRKQIIAAVIYIGAFKLTDKFLQPALLLRQYVDDATQSFGITLQQKETPTEKEKVIDDQMTDLRSVMQCIKDYDLKCDNLSQDIERQIVILGNVKEAWRRFGNFDASNFEEKERRKHSASTSAPQFQPPEKRQATAAARPHVLPAFASNSSQVNPSSQIYQNYADPGQFVSPANYHGNTSNLGGIQSSSPSQVHYNHRSPLQFAMSHHELYASLGAMQSSSSSQMCGNYRHPGQMGTAANIYDIGGSNSNAIQKAGLYHHHDLAKPHR